MRALLGEAASNQVGAIVQFLRMAFAMFSRNCFLTWLLLSTKEETVKTEAPDSRATP